MIYLLITALTIASSEPVLIEPHPECSSQVTTALMYETQTGIICINPDVVFRDVIFRGRFDD